MEIYVIQETDIGEAECRGDEYSNLIVFEKNALNELSHKYMVENNIAEKIAKEENCSIEEVSPENGKWDFHDFMEEMEQSDEYKRMTLNNNEYEIEISSYDLNNKEHLRDFYLTLKSHQEADSNFDLGFEEYILHEAFGEENVDNLNIIDKFSYDTVEAIIVKVDDKEVGDLTNIKTVKMTKY